MLVSEMITEIITEVGGSSDDTELTTKFLIFVKGALRLLPSKARVRALVNIDTITLSANTQSKALPTGFIHEVTDESVWYLNGSRRKPIYRRQRDDFNDLWTSGILGKPNYFRIYGYTMEVDRPDGVDRDIYIEFFKEVSSVESTDTFFGDDTIIAATKELIKFIYYHDYEEDESKGRTHLKIADDLLSDLDGQYMAEDLGTHVEES